MMSYTYDPEENIIHLRASGVLVRQDPIDYFQAVANDSDIKANAEERVYFMGVENIVFTYLDIEAISEAFEHFKHGEKLSRTVFVVDSDFTFGMARMITAILEPVGHDFRIERVS